MSDSVCDAVRGSRRRAGVLVARGLEDGAGGRGVREGLEDPEGLEYLEDKDSGSTRRRGGSCDRR
ncbi:hypothetical protein AB0D78_18190 [Streptomyces avermitilis]|uniref:hypothetical protein n=1 Tax=Streptomyces avermitilis TaxID=33903 RepID=UPI0033D0AAA3